ncbi:MAG: hypothetical protein NXI32_31225 [bacterium]|nr:hypothetical protein [bacterium]
MGGFLSPTEHDSVRMPASVRVIKLGGSLLDLPQIGFKLQQWLLGQPAALNLIVVGGGEIVEAVRRLDRIHQFDPSQVHWWCVDLLTTTARIAANQIPDCGLIDTQSELKSVLEAGSGSPATTTTYTVVPSAFYSRDVHEEMFPSLHEIPQAWDLPHTWDTTTDSIAALLGLLTRAGELILMKSVDPVDPNEAGQIRSACEMWAKLGLVDAAFPRIATSIPKIRWVNLRAD